MKTPVDCLLLLAPLVLVAWLLYDLVVLAAGRGAPSITRRVIDLSRRYPAVPFLTGLVLGLVCGHLFGQF